MAIEKAEITVPKVATKPITNIYSQLSPVELNSLVAVQNQLVEKSNEYAGKIDDFDFTDLQKKRLKNSLSDATLIASSYEIVQDDDYKSFIVTANGVVITIAQLTSDCQFTVMNNEGVTSEITTSSETYELGDGAIAVITFINGVLKISL